jgi:hypothetical protein
VKALAAIAGLSLSTPFTVLRLLLLLLLLAILPSSLLHAEIGATPQQCISRYGTPERDTMKEKSLLYFRKGGLCMIAHFYQGRCDLLSIFSERESMGFPEELSDEQVTSLLKSEGGFSEWIAAPRFTINGVWRTPDGKLIAVYDTMRHKLVIMTHDAYVREQRAKNSSL